MSRADASLAQNSILAPGEHSIRLHIAVAVDGPVVPAWVAEIARELANAPFVSALEFSFVAPQLSENSIPSDFKHLLFRVYSRRDRPAIRAESDPLRPVDLLTVLPEAMAAQTLPRKGDPELLLWLSSREFGNESVAEYPHGVWIYRHSIRHGYAGAGEYFWEIYHREPITTSALEVARHGRPQLRIAESHSSTEIGWSLERNRAVPYWKAVGLIVGSLRQFSIDQAAVLAKGSEAAAPLAAQGLPGNLQMIRFAAFNTARTVRRRLLFSHQEPSWMVAYRTETQRFVASTGKFDPAGFRPLPAPPGHFYADPFVHSWGGKTYLFFEDYVHALRRGVISVLEFGPDGPVGQPVRILDLPYHLSYPFVFEDRGVLYMIPETLGSKRIELYSAEGPLGPWRLVKNLWEDIAAADCTLWVQDGIYYLFACIANHAISPNEELHLFLSDRLTGPWRPHPLNPLSSDVRNSRGAGKLFRIGDRLIRPAQDCSVRYGYACHLNEIEALSPTTFSEQPFLRIEPDWLPGLIGTHTLNSIPGLEVIDGQVLESRFSESGEPLIARLQSRLRGFQTAASMRKQKSGTR